MEEYKSKSVVNAVIINALDDVFLIVQLCVKHKIEIELDLKITVDEDYIMLVNNENVIYKHYYFIQNEELCSMSRKDFELNYETIKTDEG